MIFSILFFLSLLSFFFFLLFYIRPLRKAYFDAKSREAIFSRSSENLRMEKGALLENLDEGIVTVDSSSRVTYLNWRASSFLKLDDDVSTLGRSLTEILLIDPSPIWKIAAKVIQDAITTKERIHTTFLKDSGEKLHLGLIAIPTLNKSGAILIIQDRSNQQKILEMGKDFIANASHELRTPVTIIRGFAEMLRDMEEVTEVMYDSILEKIVRNCERMENLVKNLLTIADLDQSIAPKMRQSDLVSIIESSCNQILSLHPNTHIEQLFNRENIPLYCSPELLELAFINLLKNAVKYSPSPAEIKITIAASKEDVSVAIEDRGIGIPETDLEKIFDRFYTVDKAHSRKLGGAGLGLSIVKLILAKHNAKIHATPAPSKGSIFHLSFLLT